MTQNGEVTRLVLQNMRAEELTSLERQLISLLQIVRRLLGKRPIIVPKKNERWELVDDGSMA